MIALFCLSKVLHSYQMTVKKSGPTSGPPFFIPLASVRTPEKGSLGLGILKKKFPSLAMLGENKGNLSGRDEMLGHGYRSYSLESPSF